MFNDTHDVILLVLAAVYLIALLVRAGQVNAFIRYHGVAPKGYAVSLTTPIFMILVLVTVAVIW